MILESRAEVEDTLPAYVISWEAQLWRQLDFLMSIVEVSGSSQLFHECLETRNRAFIFADSNYSTFSHGSRTDNSNGFCIRAVCWSWPPQGHVTF